MTGKGTRAHAQEVRLMAAATAVGWYVGEGCRVQRKDDVWRGKSGEWHEDRNAQVE
jgi:hypothetical protein